MASKESKMDRILGELSDTRSRLSDVLMQLTKMESTLANIIEKERKLDDDIKKLANKVEPLDTQMKSWSGSIKIFNWLAILAPILISGIFVTFNPNNSRISNLEKEFLLHTSDPQLHKNIISYIDNNFVKKTEIGSYIK